jgi:hypothetical protein
MIMSESVNGANNDQFQPVPIQTLVPATEEVAATIQIVACKSGRVYVGHAPGAEQQAFQLCLVGLDTLHRAIVERLADKLKERSLIQVAGSLESFGLGRNPSLN